MPRGDRPTQRRTSMHAFVRASLRVIAAAAAALTFVAQAQQPITLHGAVQFNDDHAFTKALVRFEELVKKYYGKPVNFVLHKNSELGLEKDYFAFMNQGISVDYGIVSPAHMSTFSKAAPFIDAPFLFRDLSSTTITLSRKRSSVSRSSSRSTTASRSISCCTRTASSVLRRTTSPS